jgi:Lipopolysaccharide-assembly
MKHTLSHAGVAAIALLTVAASTGCGYTLAGRGSFLPAYIQTIGIPIFANRTTVFNLEGLITERVRAEFIGRGKFRVVPDATGVDALLTGEVVAVSLTPTSFTTQQIASRYTATLIARVELRDMKENKVLWENPSMMFRQDFEAQSGNTALDPTAFFAQDRDAMDRMTVDFARTLVSAILEAF